MSFLGRYYIVFYRPEMGSGYHCLFPIFFFRPNRPRVGVNFRSPIPALRSRIGQWTPLPVYGLVPPPIFGGLGRIWVGLIKLTLKL